MVLGGIVLLIFGINYLKGLDLLQRRNIYHAVYPDVSGINDATPVVYHGYKVGQVIGTELMPDGSGRIDVSFQINEDRLKITKDSKAELFSADLFSRAVRIQLGTGALAERGDTLHGGAEMSLTESVSSQIDPLKRKAETMLANVDSVLTSFQLILNENARGDIDASFTNLRGTLENINATTKKLDDLVGKESNRISSIMANVDKVSGNLAANNEHLTNILANADSATAALANGRLERMMANLEGTSNELKATMDKINGGEGTLGKLMTDDSLYVNLNAATHQMDLLMEDLRLNPHRYLSIFGRKDKLPKLSGSDVERIREAYPPKTTP
ncbi:MAG: MlaD family protein [Flavobacteriales bacterium]|jgi:phospholipid/cholesterol/gamma-HCH transport system substrate-binding protein|nr:MCE family protein [Flavobacteriales bacterium]MCI1753433.1 MlaD family protein [Flavobacteriales bacterium]